MFYLKDINIFFNFIKPSINLIKILYGFFMDLSSPKPGHTTGGSGRHGAEQTAGRGDAGQNKVPTFRRPWKPRTKEILCKPVGEQNVRLTRGLSPVYHRDRECSSLLAVD